MTIDRSRVRQAIVKAHNPPYFDSKQVYAHINNNLAKWIDEAISIRENY